MKKNKGFTLIELLVVIAIIGLLSTIVLVSLNSARNKAKDARIKSDLGQLRSVAELYADGTSGNYSGVAADPTYGPQVTTLTADIASQGGTATTNWGASAYAVYSTLNVAPSATLAGWCADSTGASKASNAPAAGTYVCP